MRVKPCHYHRVGLVAQGGLTSPAARATNGYFFHGNRLKAQGQAGVSIAQQQDASAAGNNPAGRWIYGY